MRWPLPCLMLLAGCTTFDGSETHFIVEVIDEARAPIAEAVVVLDMDEYNDDELCELSPEDGVLDIAWESCEFGAFDCDETPYAVRVSKEGYASELRVIGFSRDRTMEVTLRACDGACDTPETCD